MCGLNDDTKRRPTSATQREEQVPILAFVRGAVDTVGGDDLHLDLEAYGMHQRRLLGTPAQQECVTSTYHPINGKSVHRGEDTMTTTLYAYEHGR